MLKGGLEDENNNIEDKYSFHDDRYIKPAAWGKLEDRLACVVELKDENFERLCVIDFYSAMMSTLMMVQVFDASL